MQERAADAAVGRLRSSSERSSSYAFQLDVKEDIGAESDEEEISRVPQICGNSASAVGISASGKAPASDSVRNRGRSAAEKESKRLKRLLRNRVSAQQARERKKAYLSELERRATNLEKRNSELEEKLSTLQNENQMLRHVRRTKPPSVPLSLLGIIITFSFHHNYTSIDIPLFGKLSKLVSKFHVCVLLEN